MSRDFKKYFPIFDRQPTLTYLDSAATCLKPASVILASRAYEEEFSANIARGLYPIAETATDAFEAAREKVARFIGADPEEIVFTSGTTHGINLAAQMLDRLLFPVIPNKVEGSLLHNTEIPPLEDSVGMTRKNIVVTELEHHSNFLPWKELARSKNIELRIAPFTDEGIVDSAKLASLIDDHTAVVAFSAISNVMGGINPIPEIIRAVRAKNPKTIIAVDAAQAAAHIRIDASLWNADFIAFSGHKMYGPTGIGILYGKKEVLKKCSPVAFGGGMVADSCADIPEYREIPYRFEAGTQNISGAIGLGKAIDFIAGIGLEEIRRHDIGLSEYTTKKLTREFGDSIRILGPREAKERSSLLSFTLEGIHPHDLAHILGEKNICIRAGEHCAAPLHRALDLAATARISFGIYTTKEDMDKLIFEIKNIQEFLG